MLKRRFFGLFLVLVFFCTTFFFSPFSLRADSTKLAKIISKDPSVVGLCYENGISIFETYETFFLAEIKDQQEETLKNLGLNYEVIQDANKIKFGGFEFISDENKNLVYPSDLFINPSYASKQLYFVQFIGPIKQEWKDTLTQNEMNIGLSVDQFGLIIQTSQSSIEFLKSLRFVKSVGTFPDACKMSPIFDATQERMDLNIITLRHLNVKEIQDLIHDIATQYYYEESSSYGSLIIKNCLLSNLPKLSQNQNILTISPLEKPLTYNAEASKVLNINDSSDQNQISGLKGEGEIVGVADTGLSSGNIATLHPAFTGKIVAAFPTASGTYPNPGWYDVNGHGTHVCGSVLGSGAGDTTPYSPRYKGMAPEAKLVIQYNGYTGSIYTILNDAYNSGARIHTNSWSNQNNSWGQYDSDAMSIDQLMWEHMDMQVLFAAGNSRSSSQYGVWPPPYNGTRSLTNFCGAKNGIAVGASQNNNTNYFFQRMSSFSSLGPTHDGRIKPDLIAPGNQIRSTYTYAYYNPYPTVSYTAEYRSMSGTSMASPVTAGALALVRENFRKIYRLPPTEIPASLLKATMINGCNTTNVYDYQTYSGGPQLFLSRNNFTSGFGRVDIKNSLFPTDKTWMFYNEYASDGSKGLKQGELTKKYYVHVTKTNQPLKATLVWTDMPGTPCTYSYDSTIDPLTGRRRGWVPSDFVGNNPDLTPELVNDLDITIRKYDGLTEQFIGNRFESNGYSSNIAGLNLINPYDVVNNVEVVNIQNPTLGVYEIEISATRSSIQSDAAHGFRQPYSLVVSGEAIDTANIPNKPLLLSGITKCDSNELTWSDGRPIKDPIQNYRLTRFAVTGPTAGNIETYIFPATTHFYSDKNIITGTEYFYYIQAIDITGLVSDFSTGIQLGYIVPPGITGFYPPVIRPTNVVLYWSTPKPGTCPVAGYYLYRSSSIGILGAVISPLISNVQPAFADTNVTQGETYFYSVVAVDTHGYMGAPSQQLKVSIPMDQTDTTLSIEASKRELCQGDPITIKIVISNKSAVDTEVLRLYFAPPTDISYTNSDRLTGVKMPSGAIEFLIGAIPAKGTFTFSLFCNQSGSVQQERSTKLIFTLSNPKEILNQEELTLLIKKCGGGNTQGSLEISAKLLNVITDPATGERYLPFDEELKLFLDLFGGVGPYQLKINWGDGKVDTKKIEKLESQSLTHKYDSKGVMNISIELSDSSGNTKKISFTVKVK